MATAADPRTETIETPVSRALTAAVTASRRRRHEITKEAKVTERALQRYMSGERVPKHKVRNRILLACGAAPATCLLSSELGFATLIGSEWQPYIDQYIPELYDLIKNSSENGLEPVEARRAKRDARMMFAVWEQAQKQKQAYLDRLAEEGG